MINANKVIYYSSYEMMAEPQRDITPEQAAARLRGCGGQLYRTRLVEESMNKEEFGQESKLGK